MADLDRVKGGLFGAVIGDIIGVPYEFKTPQQIADVGGESVIDIDFSKHTGKMLKTYHTVPFGYWSDDTSLILALSDALVTPGSTANLPRAFIENLIQWRTKGKFAVNNRVFDIGMQTANAVEYLIDNPTATSVPYDEQCQGNGALMRCLPVALFNQNVSVDDVLQLARIHTITTHNSDVAVMCSQYYTLIARNLLHHQNIHEAIYNATRVMQGHHLVPPSYQVVATKLATVDCEGSGWVIDSLATALQILKQSSTYEYAIKQAVALGNDSDTTACIVGGLAGIMYGYNSIPSHWKDSIADKVQIGYAYRLIETFWK